MGKRVWPAVIGALVLATAGSGLGASGADAAAQERRGEQEAGDRLGAAIQRGLREGGPFFNAQERAMIERECGYAPGSWDGYELNMSNGVFTCSNGRRIDSPEVRAVVEAARPRIEARVERTMASAEVRTAIDEIAQNAEAAALRGIDAARIAEEASMRAREATRRAFGEAREARRRARD